MFIPIEDVQNICQELEKLDQKYSGVEDPKDQFDESDKLRKECNEIIDRESGNLRDKAKRKLAAASKMAEATGPEVAD